MIEAVYRLDRFDLDQARAQETEHGRLLIKGAIIARGGVLEYRRGDGTIRRELRDPEVMHAPEALARYEGSPLLLATHPTRADGTPDLHTPENARQWRTVGTVTRVRPDVATDPETGRQVPVTRADILVTDADAIRAIKSGMRQFSVGYEATVEHAPGAWMGQEYDARQTSDIGNHVAIVQTARAGKITEFRMDAMGAVLVADSQGREPASRGANMASITVDGVSGEVDAGLVAPLTAALKRADMYDEAKKEMEEMESDKGDADSKIAELEAKVSELMGEIKALKASADAEPKGDAIQEAVQARLDLMQQAAPILGKGYDWSGKTDADIKGDAIKAALGIDVEPGELPGAWKVVQSRFSNPGGLADAIRTGPERKGDSRNAYQKFIQSHHSGFSATTDKEG